jgi:excisionase family DNA binding protein
LNEGGAKMGLDNLQDIITVKQLSEFLQISELTIKRALKSGELKGFKIGSGWRIEKEEVLKWLDTKK